MPNDKEFELDDLESFSFDDLSLDDVPPGSDAPSAEDPLGVWVKSGPEDLDTAEESTVEIPESPVAAEDLPEEDFLSSEELANLDDSFEFVTVSEEPLEGETTLDDDMAFLDTPEAVEAERSAKVAETESSFNDVSLDDFVSFEDVSSDDETSPASKALGQDSPALLEDEALEEEPFDEEFLDIDIDIEDDINDEELEIVEGAKPRAQASSESKHGSEEVDLSEFVDFEEVSPSQDDLSAAEDLPEVETDDTFFAETNLDDSLPALEDEGAVVLEVDLEPDDHTDMDSLIALEEDLTSGIREPSETDEAPVVLAPVSASPQPAPEPARVEPAPRQEPDLAAQILGKIEQELSSIKQEISELKQEMTHFRSAPQAAPAVSEPREAKVPQEALADEEPLAGEFAPPEGEAEKASHGFFDEEDDETIALTGDELDNILSTAEISEGEEVGLSLDEDLLSLDPEGNLVEPEPEVSADSEEVHVTDEEFLAGTSLDLNEPVVLEDEEAGLGVPESIELEESLPSDLDDSETEDLLADDLFGEPADAEEIALEAEELVLEEDPGLEAVDSVPLAPELADDLPGSSDEWDLDSLPPLTENNDQADLGADAEGWSSPQAEAPVEEELPVEPEEISGVAQEEALPPPPPVSAQPVDGREPLPSGLKDELRAVLTYMDKLLASLPDDKIQEFAESEHFEVYKRLFEELGLIE